MKHPAALSLVIVIFFGCSFLASTACAQSQAPVDPRIKAEIATVDTQIQEAEADNAKYAGGLVKAIIECRLATLKQTRAMLGQRAVAADLNVMIRYTVDGKPFTTPDSAAAELSAVEAELATMKSKVAEAEANAGRYAGGLVQAMSHVTLETARQSQAMLEQKRLALKYGLPQFVGFADLNRAASTPSYPPAAPVGTSGKAAQPADVKDWEIVSIDAKVTESNNVWWRYAWKLTVRNKGTVAHAFNATIEFQDKDGFVIDTSHSDVFVVEPNADYTSTGYTLISTPGASNVGRTNAKVFVVK